MEFLTGCLIDCYNFKKENEGTATFKWRTDIDILLIFCVAMKKKLLLLYAKITALNIY